MWRSGKSTGHDRTGSGWALNAYGSVLAIPVTALVVAVFIAVWGVDPLLDSLAYVHGVDRALPTLLVALAVGVAWYCGHELVHAAAYLLVGGSRSDVQIGFSWKALHAYVYYRRAMPARTYRLVTAMPALVLGVLPWVLAVATGSVAALLIGWFGLVGAVGDLAILVRLRGVAGGRLVADSADRPGCRVLG